jgi:hypothetical protein
MTVRSRWLATLVVVALAAWIAPPAHASSSTTPVGGSGCDGTWHVVKSPVQKSHQTSFAAVSAISSTDAWAVGSDIGPNGSRPRAEHWDGQAWTTVATPLPQGGVYGFLLGVSARTSTDVWAVGGYQSSTGDYLTLIERWNGTRWKVVSSGILGVGTQAMSVDAIAANDVWLVGRSGTAVYTTLTAHWNGSVWKVVPSPNQQGSVDNWLTGVSAVGANDVWASGSWTSASWSNGLTEHWDGTAWKIVKSKPAFNLPAIAAISANDVWTAGIDAGGTSVFTEHWDGSKWNAVAAPPGSDVSIGGVAAAATDDVWLFGTTFPGVVGVLTEHWNGSTWTTIAAATPPAVAINVGGVAVTPDGATAFAVATYWKDASSNARTLVEMWC